MIAREANLLTDPKLFQDVCKRGGQVHACMRLGNLHDIEQQNDRLPLVLEMHGHSDERAVIRRRPRVGREAQRALVLLLLVSATHLWTSHELTDLQHSCNPTPRPLEHGFHIARDGRRRWEVVSRAPSLHQGDEPPIADNLERTDTLAHPLDNFGTGLDSRVLAMGVSHDGTLFALEERRY